MLKSIKEYIYKKYIPIYIKIRNGRHKKVFDFCFGVKALISLARKYNYKRHLILVTTMNLGDCLYALSCLDTYKRKNPEKKIVVIARENHRSILETYPQIDKLILCTRYRSIDMYNSFLRTKSLFKIGKKLNIFQTNPYFWGKEICKEYDLISVLQEHLFGTKRNDVITYPSLPLVQVNSIKDFQRDKDRIVILNPYSYGWVFKNDDLFERLCVVLKQMGYVVYTNVVGNQAVVEGSFELRCSIIELYSIAMEIPYVISIRSGILDLLINTNTTIITLYGKCGELFKTLYTLMGWKKGRVYEIFDIVDTDNALNNIKDIIEQDSSLIKKDKCEEKE